MREGAKILELKARGMREEGRERLGILTPSHQVFIFLTVDSFLHENYCNPILLGMLFWEICIKTHRSRFYSASALGET